MSAHALATPPPLKFDWYQATIRDETHAGKPEELIDLFAGDLGATSVDVGMGINGYSHSATLKDVRGETVCRVMYGGRNRWPNCVASGDPSPAFARSVRGRFPSTHHVTRADVAYDVRGPRAFEDLSRACLRVADDRGLKVSHAGDWHRAIEGRTIYCGSKHSEQMIRVYEKGLEQRGKAPTPAIAEAIPADWVRVELRWRPEKAPRRMAAALLEPAEMFGCATWTRVVAKQLWDIEVERVDASTWKPTADEVALRWMVRQYGQLMGREAIRLGSWESLGLRLGRLVETREPVGLLGPEEVSGE